MTEDERRSRKMIDRWARTLDHSVKENGRIFDAVMTDHLRRVLSRGGEMPEDHHRWGKRIFVEWVDFGQSLFADLLERGLESEDARWVAFTAVVAKTWRDEVLGISPWKDDDNEKKEV